MTTTASRRVNGVAFVTGLSGLVAAVVIALLGIWDVLPPGAMLWRLLATASVFFFGSIAASLGVRCFRTNESI